MKNETADAASHPITASSTAPRILVWHYCDWPPRSKAEPAQSRPRQASDHLPDSLSRRRRRLAGTAEKKKGKRKKKKKKKTLSGWDRHGDMNATSRPGVQGPPDSYLVCTCHPSGAAGTSHLVPMLGPCLHRRSEGVTPSAAPVSVSRALRAPRRTRVSIADGGDWPGVNPAAFPFSNLGGEGPGRPIRRERWGRGRRGTLRIVVIRIP